MKIAAVASALPPREYDQRAVTARLERIWAGHPGVLRRLPEIHGRCGVETRRFVLPIERYETLATFGEFNDEWIRGAMELGEASIRAALDRAGLSPRDVDAIFFASVTGIAAPAIDARRAHVLDFRSDVRRTPIFGLGCVAGAAAVSRAADFLRGRPDGVALVLAVELCSLTWQRGDTSLAHVISTGLFGDGAGCAVLVGAEREAAGPAIVDTRSVFYRDTEELMGWRVSERGFSIQLSPDVPRVARERLGPDVDAFLADHGLSRERIGFWVCHPGGPKVLEGARDSLGITDDDLALSWESLRTIGNLSSASVLYILEQTLRRRPPPPGALGVMLAMGPGFCSELLLLRAGGG